MAQLVVKSATAADATFSATGTTVWNAGMTPNSGQLTAAFGGTGIDGSAAGNGKLLIGNGSGFTLASLTAGSNITLTPGAGSISIASSGGSSSPTFPGGIPLTGVKYRSAWGSALATGDNDLVFTEGGTATVPAGKRWMIVSMACFNNSGVGNILAFTQIKISGSYYRLSSTGTLTNQNIATLITGYIAEAGETISINTATNNGLNVIANIVEFDNTVGLMSSKILTVSAGANTVYTVTSGKTGVLLQGGSGASTIPVMLGAAGSALNYVNASGGARTYSWNIVPSGGTVGSGNIFIASTSTNADVTRKQDAGAPTLSQGDFINLTVDAGTATQWAWVNVMEI